MIPHQLSLPSSSYFQSREVEAKSSSSISSVNPSLPVARIRKSQDMPATKRIRRKVKLNPEQKLNSQSQRNILTSLINIMLSQEKLICSKEVTIELFTLSVESLLTLNAKKLYSSRVMNAALRTEEKLIHLKTLITELKVTESTRLSEKQKSKHKKFDASAVIEIKINNLKTAIYTAIIDVIRAGYEYHWQLNILNDKVTVLPKSIDRKQCYMNRKNRLALESLKKKQAEYSAKMQNLKSRNINEQEILRTLSNFLFRYKMISFIKALFPDLQEAEMLQIIRKNLTSQITAIPEQLLAQYNIEQYHAERPSTSAAPSATQIATNPLTIPICEIKLLQKHRKPNPEIFWQSFDQELSDAELKIKFEEFLFSNWDIDPDFNKQLTLIFSQALINQNLRQQHEILSLRILHRQMHKFAGEFFKYILNVKKIYTLLITASEENWAELQKKLDFALDNIQANFLLAVRRYHQQYINRNKRDKILTPQDIKKLQTQRGNLRTSSNKVRAETLKTLPKSLNYVSYALHILKVHGQIDANTLFFLAQHTPEMDEANLDIIATTSTCAKRPSSAPPLQFPTEIIAPALKKKAVEGNREWQQRIQFTTSVTAASALADDTLASPLKCERANTLRFVPETASTLHAISGVSFEELLVTQSQNVEEDDYSHLNIMDFDLSLLEDPNSLDQS